MHNSLKCVSLRMLSVTSSKNYNSELFKQGRKFIGSHNWKKYKGGGGSRKDSAAKSFFLSISFAFCCLFLKAGFHGNLQPLPGLPHSGSHEWESLYPYIFCKSLDCSGLGHITVFSLNHCSQEMWNALLDLPWVKAVLLKRLSQLPWNCFDLQREVCWERENRCYMSSA